MRYQEVFFTAFVFGGAIASYNCRDSGNMPLRHGRSTPMPLPQTHKHHFTPAGTALRPSWSYLRAGRPAFGGSIPHQTTPACWLQRAGPLAAGVLLFAL